MKTIEVVFGNKKGQFVEFSRSRDRLMVLAKFEQQKTPRPIIHKKDGNGLVGIGQEGGNILDVIMFEKDFEKLIRTL